MTAYEDRTGQRIRLVWSAGTRDAARRSPWWWSMAENPACPSWCADQHDVDDFRVEGSLTCSTLVGQVLVSVTYTADEDVPFSVQRSATTVSLPDFEQLSPSAARLLAADLEQAAAFAAAADAPPPTSMVTPMPSEEPFVRPATCATCDRAQDDTDRHWTRRNFIIRPDGAGLMCPVCQRRLKRGTL